MGANQSSDASNLVLNPDFMRVVTVPPLNNSAINGVSIGESNNSAAMAGQNQNQKQDQNAPGPSQSSRNATLPQLSPATPVTLYPANWTDYSNNCNGSSSLFLCTVVNKTDKGVVEKTDTDLIDNNDNNNNNNDNNSNNPVASLPDRVFKLSTNSTFSNTWSRISGNEIPVKAGQKYMVMVNTKLNEFATQSHAVVEGLNDTSKGWFTLTQCPVGTDGPTGWNRYACTLDVLEPVTKLRLVLNAGWSSQPGMDAVTYFGGAHLFKINDNKAYEADFNNLVSDNSLTNTTGLPGIFAHKPPNYTNTTNSYGINAISGIKTYKKIDPTLWKISISESNATSHIKNVGSHDNQSIILAFAEAFNPFWEAKIYQNGSLVETAKSQPLYGAINGFEIHQSGNLDVVIQYTSQYWFNIGIKISLFILVSLFVLVLITLRRQKEIQKIDLH
jgi:hypothetical protein